MTREVSTVHSHMNARNSVPLRLSRQDITHAALGELRSLGITIPERIVGQMVDGLGMDAVSVSEQEPYAPTVSGFTTPNLGVPLQFLQNWLPGFVAYITSARKIDQLIGMTTVGSWEDEEVICTIVENLGEAVPYGDLNSVPLSSWNPTYEARTVQRFEAGLSVGLLEESRTSRARINSADTKRRGAAEQLEIVRNRIGFFGFNSAGTSRTYGFLNEPSLLPALTVPTGAAKSTYWKSKTFLEIISDIQMAMAQLQIQSQDRIDPTETALTFALPTGVNQYLSTASDLGYSVRQWAKDNYPKLRFVSAPELQESVGGVDVAYLYPDEIDDGVSTDDHRVFEQLVPTKFMTIGVEKRVKTYLEDYGSASAGVILKRPYAVVRITGI